MHDVSEWTTGDRRALPPELRGNMATGKAAQGGVGFPVAAPGEGGATARVANLPPPWQFPIASAVDFFQQAQNMILPAGVGATITDAALPLAMQDGYKAVVRSVVIFVDAPTTALSFFFTLLVNGAPVQGWDRLRTYPRSATNLSIGFEGVVRVPQNATISGIVTNENAAGPWTVGMNFAGWQWPLSDEQRIYGGDFG